LALASSSSLCDSAACFASSSRLAATCASHFGCRVPHTIADLNPSTNAY
jgi:hypothetical protein